MLPEVLSNHLNILGNIPRRRKDIGIDPLKDEGSLLPIDPPGLVDESAELGDHYNLVTVYSKLPENFVHDT